MVDVDQASSFVWRRFAQINEESAGDQGDRVHVRLIGRSMALLIIWVRCGVISHDLLDAGYFKTWCHV